MYIAYGKAFGLVTIICTTLLDHAFFSKKDEAELRRQAKDVIFDLGADDHYKDALRKTLSFLPLEKFMHDVEEL